MRGEHEKTHRQTETVRRTARFMAALRRGGQGAAGPRVRTFGEGAAAPVLPCLRLRLRRGGVLPLRAGRKRSGRNARADGARRKALGRFRGIYPRVASLGGAGGAACAGLPRRPRRIAALKGARPAHGKHFPCAFCISVKNFFFASTVLTDVNFLCIVERTKSAARGRRRFA